MKEYIDLIEYLTGEFHTYNVGLQDVMELEEKVSYMMEANRAAFIAFNQERTDKGLSIMPIDALLIREMLHFLNLDQKRFSGMDIEKGQYNKADYLHMQADRWVSVYIQCYTSPLKDEPQQEASNSQQEASNPQQEASQPNGAAYLDILPEKLVDGMIAQGLVERAGNGLKWLGTKSLLAYFAELASEKYKLGKGEYNGKVKTAWKPFETLFGIKGLCDARNGNIKTGTKPDGYRKIDELFKE